MGKRILIVDDSMVARMMLKSLLDELAPDYTIFEASNASEANAILAKEELDIVSIDYNMPEENGLDLAVDIRKRNADITIAVLTANIQDSFKKKVQEKGFFFLEKPISKETVEYLLTL